MKPKIKLFAGVKAQWLTATVWLFLFYTFSFFLDSFTHLCPVDQSRALWVYFHCHKCMWYYFVSSERGWRELILNIDLIPKVMPRSLSPSFRNPGESNCSQLFDANSTDVDNPTGFAWVLHLISSSTHVVTLSVGGLDTTWTLEMDYLENGV